FTFGGGFSYTYDPANRAVSGKIDFIGVAMHEFSEIMGRIPLMGENLSGSPDYMLMDLFHYTGAGVRGLNNGPSRFFSIDNGTTLLKAFNFPNGNGSDPQDWASGTNDCFNAFASSSVKNDLTPVDLRVMDVIGYDFASSSPTPTPTATPTPTSTGTPTPTVTPTPTPITGSAVMLNPAPGSTFTSSSVTFTWSAGSATAYFLFVGSSPNGADIYNSGQVTVLSKIVNNIPTDGRTIYVTLGSRINGSWTTNSYTYTAFKSSATPKPTPTPTLTPTPTPTPTATPTPTPATVPAVMIISPPGSTFTSSSVTFTWSAGSATAYFLFVGSSPNGADIYNSGQVTVLSKTVNSIPSDGRTIYVTLGSRVNGSWTTNHYMYTAFNSSATPTPTPTVTPTATPTVTPTPTPTPTVTPTPTPTPTPTVTPTPTPTPSAITLSAHGRRVQGRHTVDLTWSPVTSPNIDIYRDGVVIATVPNTGSYKD